MSAFVALLRAVNVGGTGKLAMSDLKSICEAAGYAAVRTYIASGNVVFQAEADEAQVKAELESRLEAHAGRPLGVIVRTAAEMAQVAADNPFAEAPGNRVMALFLDEVASPALLDEVSGCGADEALHLGRREIYIHYGQGMADTKLKIPAAKRGTARNMNTVLKLVELSRV